MKTLNEEQKKEMLVEHTEAMKEMGEDIAFIDKTLGRNHTGATKMRQIHEIMSSMTAEEIVDVGLCLEQLQEEEEKNS